MMKQKKEIWKALGKINKKTCYEFPLHCSSWNFKANQIDLIEKVSYCTMVW